MKEQQLQRLNDSVTQCTIQELKRKLSYDILVAEDCFPQTIDVLKSRAIPLGIELIIISHKDFQFTEEVFGCLVQYPAKYGEIHDYRTLLNKQKK